MKKLIVFIALLGVLPYSYADCPDGKYTCPSTSEKITFGRCYSWSSVACKPCNQDYKKRCQKLSYENWMTNSKNIQSSSLSEISIPGAHDAGMGEISSCSDYANAKVTKTQNRSFLQMLNSGVRYFDLRPIVDKSGNMQLGHFSWIGKNIDIGVKELTLRNEGCFGYSVERMLIDVNLFLSNSKNEVVFLNFSHFKDFQSFNNKNSHFDREDFANLEKNIEDYIGRHLVYSNENFIKTKISKLTKSGPKAVVVFDSPGYDGEKGIYSKKYANIYDKYSDTNDLEKMTTDQIKKMKKHADSKYFVLSWTLTQSEDQTIGCMIPGNAGKIFGYDCWSIESLAKKANYQLDTSLYPSVLDSEKIPNVIYADFVSTKQTKSAIVINKTKHSANSPPLAPKLEIED